MADFFDSIIDNGVVGVLDAPNLSVCSDFQTSNSPVNPPFFYILKIFGFDIKIRNSLKAKQLSNVFFLRGYSIYNILQFKH